MPSTKRPVSQTFLIHARDQLLLVTLTPAFSGAGPITSRAIGRLLRCAIPHMITLMEGAEDGTRKRSTRNGSARSSKRKNGSGKRGG